MMDMEEGTEQQLSCSYWAVGIPDKDEEPLSPDFLWTPKTHLLAPLESGCAVLYLQNQQCLL